MLRAGNETIQNAPKHYETHQNISLGSNRVDLVRLLRKIPMRLRGMNFCTSSARSAPSFVRQPNSPKCTKIVQIAQKQKFRVQWGGSGAFVAKNSNATSWHELFPQLTRFTLSVVGQKMVPNVLKKYETHQNMSLGSNGVDRVHSMRKILTRLRGTNFCISSARFPSSFASQPNGPKCIKIV